MFRLSIIISTFFFAFVVTLNAQVTSLPFCEDFENGILNPNYWEANPGTVNGVAEVANQYGGFDVAHTGVYGFVMGKSSDGGAFNTNTLDLHLDLSAYEGAELQFTFCVQDYNDENDGDGILMSDDGGLTWQSGISLFAIPFQPESWTPSLVYGSYVFFDLDNIMDQYNLGYTNNFIIRFQQRGEGDFNSFGDEDGMMFDDICIQVETPVVPVETLPYFEGFDNHDGAFPPAWRLANPVEDGGTASNADLTRFPLVRIDDSNNPVSEPYELVMGKTRDSEGNNINAVDLHLKLADYAEEELNFSFWITDLSDENDGGDAIYFSDDNGATFEKVILLTPEAWTPSLTYGARVFYDLDCLIGENDNLDFTDQFVIRFQQEGEGDFNTFGEEDGFRIDNVYVGVERTVEPVTSLPYCEGFDDDNGALPPAWRVANPFKDGSTVNVENVLTRYPIVALLDVWQPISEPYELVMGKSSDSEGTNVNAIDLHLDLSAYANEELLFSFWIADYFDETDGADGLYFSDDNGLNFYKVVDFLPELWPDNTYGWRLPYDLDDLINDHAELDFTDQFIIRFQQSGNGDFNTFGQEDGFRIDDVCIEIERPIVYGELPYVEHFEDDSLRYSWRVANAVEEGGTASSGLSHFPLSVVLDEATVPGVNHTPDGAQAFVMGKWNSGGGNNVNALDLHLNMLNAIGCDDVLLNFWLLDVSDENNGEDKILFSNDGGLNFYTLLQLLPENYPNFSYQEFTLDLDEFVTSNNLAFTDQCVIRFQQFDDADFNTFGDEDGFYLDDVSVFTATTEFDESVSICEGEAYNGYTQTGIYSDTIFSNFACDTVYTLDLIVSPVINLEDSMIESDLNNTSEGEGSITLNLNGGTLPFTYAWNNGETTLAINNLQGGLTYELTVTDALACSYTFDFEVPLDIIDGIKTVDPYLELTCFPNPSHEVINIQWPDVLEGEELVLTFYNTLGQVQLTKSIRVTETSTPFDISSLPAGLCFIKGLSEEGAILGKFIKQ